MADSPVHAPGAPRRTTTEQVADEIRSHIQSEGLVPGDRLGREEDLARRFGISRPTLREALRLLSSSHLIKATTGPGGGIFVAATPEQGIANTVTESVAMMLFTQSIEMDELLETRILLEVPLVGLAAQRANDGDVAALMAIIQRPSTDATTDVVDSALHRAIATIAGNRLAGALTEWVVEVLQPSLSELIAPAVVDSVIVDQHRDIVRAIERGDPIAAERAMREHLTYLRDLVSVMKGADAAA